MNDSLPIVIQATRELAIHLPRINNIINKVEAECNLQTMTRHWYDVEDNIIFIHLQLQTPLDFTEQLIAYADQSNFTQFSDDVFSLYQKPSNQLRCIIAITAGELSLLGTQQKLLAPYLQKKLHKVLNLIAGQLMLAELPPLSPK